MYSIYISAFSVLIDYSLGIMYIVTNYTKTDIPVESCTLLLNGYEVLNNLVIQCYRKIFN